MLTLLLFLILWPMVAGLCAWPQFHIEGGLKAMTWRDWLALAAVSGIAALVFALIIVGAGATISNL